MLESQIKLFELETHRKIPAAPGTSVALSSENLGWQGIKVELHNLPPMEMPEHQIESHRLMIHLGKPIFYEWKSGGRWQQKQLHTGDFSLQSHGELNAPRWTQPLDILAVALEPEFVGRIFQESVQLNQIVFQERRCERDEMIARFATHFNDELVSHNYSGKLYGESLAMAFSLHLLEQYATLPQHLKMPHGKLAAAPLRHVLEFVHAHLGEDLSIEDMAKESYLSAFHFARLFKNTLGLSPHQYVLQTRIERAKRLMTKLPRLNLTDIGLAVGFFDQAHFTKAFKRATGATPKLFLKHAV